MPVGGVAPVTLRGRTTIAPGVGSGAGTIAPQTNDTVRLSGQGNLPVPNEPKYRVAQRLGHLIGQLFSFQATDRNGIIEFLAEHIDSEDNIDLTNPEVREKLKDILVTELGIPRNDVDRFIKNGALDYFFGKVQDGKHTSEDKMSASLLVLRLQKMVAFHQAVVKAGGPSAFQYLGTDDITVLDFSGSLDGEAIDLCARSGEQLFQDNIRIALSNYAGMSKENAEWVQKNYEDIMSGKKKFKDYPDDLKQILFAAYYGGFKNHVISRHIQIDYEDLQKKGELEAFFKGPFADYVCGHSAPGDPQAITHDVPKEKADINKSYLDQYPRSSQPPVDPNALPTPNQ